MSTAVDLNRGSDGLSLPASVSAEILGKTVEASVIQAASRRVTLPGNGAFISVITGEPIADWVGETEAKPVSNGSAAHKLVRPYKLSVIETFSNEYRRDLSALYGALVERLPAALALKFDRTVFHGSAPGSDFDTFASIATQDIETDTYTGLVAALETIADNDYDANGVIIAPQGEAQILKAVDDQNRPLFIENLQAEGAIGSVLGRPVFKSRAAYDAGPPRALGVMGDWTQAVYGAVNDVTVRISDQATLTAGESTINLFQQNMFAVLAEIEVGFRLGDADAFVKLTGEDAS